MSQTEPVDMEEISFNLEPTEKEVLTLKERQYEDEDEELEDGEIEEFFEDETNEDNEQAQTVFNTLMNEKDKRLSELIISNSLKGPLDFAVLQKMGFDCIKKIVFQKKGGITRVQNLPKDLVIFECSQQALTTLGVLPPHLEELNVSENSLTELDLVSVPKLKKLDITDNHITLLENIPADLEELYADGNYLEELNLVNAQNLKVLYVSRNTEYLVISHFPSASIVDFQHENTSYSTPTGSTQVAPKSKGKKQGISYDEALNNYYELKEKYEGVKKKCPNCEQNGGLLFSTDGKHLLATCGNINNPCSFKIQLFRSFFKNKQNHREELEKQVLSVGDETIRVNLDVAFEFIQETQAVSKYSKLKEKKHLLDLEKERLNEPLQKKEEREEQLIETQRQIKDILNILKNDLAEFKKNKDRVVLERIMDLQVNQYLPLLEKERNLKWDYTETVVFGRKTGFDNSPQYGCRLVHYSKGEYVEDLLIGEPPSIVK